MLMANGITALQNATIIMGLPFSFVIFLVMAGLYKSLRLEDFRQASTSMNAALWWAMSIFLTGKTSEPGYAPSGNYRNQAYAG